MCPAINDRLLRFSASGGNGAAPAAGLESSIVDETVMALLECVRTGQVAPAEAAMQLRERAAGYQQVCAPPGYCKGTTTALAEACGPMEPLGSAQLLRGRHTCMLAPLI